MRLHGRLSAIEDEWHIRGIPEWIDPVFTFQRTWLTIPDRMERTTFNATLAKAFAVIGGGLLGYYVWEKTHHKPYTALAGAGGFIVAPMLVAAYDEYTYENAALNPDSSDSTDAGADTNTYTETGTETTPTLVPASPDVKAILTAARQLPTSQVIRAAVAYKEPLI